MKILSCGAGQQSTALALMSCENKITGLNKYPLVPVYDAILFCDLGGERKWVYEQVDFIKSICEKAGIPFYILKAKNLLDDYMKNFGEKRVVTVPFWSIDENGKKGKMTRHCTIDYKIIQMQNFVRWHLLGYRKGQRTKPEDVQAHEMHIGFTVEEQQRIFDSKHKLFVNKFPMVDMGLTRADNYAYVRERWGLKTRGSACLFCPFHTNYFFAECKRSCQEDYKTIVSFDEMIGKGIPNKKLGVPDSKIYVSRSRKRIRELKKSECQDSETFNYKGEKIWNGF
ncbi:hypothetical protein M2146_002512 [Lachnospiraceae bacterium PF1-22]